MLCFFERGSLGNCRGGPLLRVLDLALRSPHMATLTDFPHSLETSRRVTWSTVQEKSISNDFPFDRNEETPEQFVFRTYLQFLWLPEVLSTAFYAYYGADTLYSQ